MRLRQTLIAAALVLGLPLSTSAQSPAGTDPARGDLFAGYSYLRSGDGSLHGGMVSLGWKLTGPIALVAELASHQGTVDGEDVTSTSAFGGGRFAFGDGSIRPFIQAVAGVVRTRAGISIFDVDITESNTGFGGAAGVGVDFKVGRRWAVRVQADYQVAKPETETVSDPRASVGAVLRFGSR